MAAREELYSKVTPRRDRLQRPGTVKHGSALDVLLSMGFPRARADWTVDGYRDDMSAGPGPVLICSVFLKLTTPQGLEEAFSGECS
ncbi:Ubiquitin-associated and SH3 domain-containing protein B [Cricetulus griseus]|uniref:Ubiquitin-associated and SH3 domain-containing protein B n=1 Tax=Cricetulus griseus TaxID=10029 RepID=G3IFY8_CRIGR|nr:Ubiquitin-associated and SH3 domain-containing protein B [Cricetulus griseus]